MREYSSVRNDVGFLMGEVYQGTLELKANLPEEIGT